MSDEVIREVRQARHDISRSGGHDVHRVIAVYRQFQDELKRSNKYRFAAPNGGRASETPATIPRQRS